MKNTICIQHVYTIRMQHKIYTTQKIQHKVGILCASLETLRRSPRSGAKRNHLNQRGVIPYQEYVYIEIYFNQKKPIHCNARFEGICGDTYGLPWFYRVPIRTRL